MSLDSRVELPEALPRLLNAVTTPILVLDSGARLLFANDAARACATIFEGSVGRCAGDLLPGARPFLDEATGPAGAVRRVICERGVERVLRWHATSMAGAEDCIVCTATDITGHEPVPPQQPLLERQLRSLVANVPALLWAVDSEGVFTLAEGRGLAALQLLNIDLVGRNVRDVLGGFPDILDHLERARNGEAFSALAQLGTRTLDAYFEPLRDESGAINGVAGVATDVTERRRQDMTLAQAQKMESLGVMAGSVAHDFNNLLTAILGFAGLLKLSPSLDPRDREQLYHIEQAARRGADIAGRLLSFSRGGLARFVGVDLCAVVQETARLVSPTLPDRIRLVLDLPTRKVMVEGDDGQLQQALMNIVLNARDALGGVGTIHVQLGTQDDHACLLVTDDGPGIDEATRARIFEPFFTTKQPGSGTGLGLAITYGIVRGHKGDISLQSEVGAGTTFTMNFPLLSPGRTSGPDIDAGEGNLVLLVDDDELVRRSTSATLSNLGYNVVEVGNGALAVDLIKARPGRFSAVLLDLVMPGMTGREVFHALAALRSDLPVVVCTGYAADAHIDDTMKRSIAGLLQKPFSPEHLAEVLESVGARPAQRIPMFIS